MKLSHHQVISTYLVLQATALPKDSKGPKGLQPSDFEHYDLDPTTINPGFAPTLATFVVEESTPATITTTVEYEVTTETSSPTLDETAYASSPSTPAESSPPGTNLGALPLYGNMYPGKPIWQCWYEKKFARNYFHLTAVNWNMTESEVKNACKKSDAMTAWEWSEPNAQMFTAKFQLPIKTANRLENSLNDLIRPIADKFPDLPKVKCPSNKPDYPLEAQGVPPHMEA